MAVQHGGMIAARRGARTLSAIASGFTYALVVHTPNVTLEKRRRLGLMIRKAPMGESRTQNLLTVTLMDGIIFPPMPSLSTGLQNVEELDDFTVDLYGFSSRGDELARWGRLPVLRTDRVPNGGD